MVDIVLVGEKGFEGSWGGLGVKVVFFGGWILLKAAFRAFYTSGHTHAVG